MIRLALVGAGKWGRNYIKAADDSGAAKVVEVVGRSGKIDPEGIDAVVVATPPHSHLERCEEALALNLPVMVEKPATLSLADAERLVEAEALSKAFVLVGHQHLFADGFEVFRDVARGCGVIARSFGPVKRADYSSLWDYGPHAVSMALAISSAIEARQNYTMAALHFSHRGGWVVAGNAATKECTASWELTGEGTITYDAYASQAEPPLTRQVRAFAKAVKAGGTDDYRFGAKWAVDVARVLESASNH